MQRFRFPIAVTLTSLALTVTFLAIGGVLVGNALASSPLRGVFMAAGGPWAGGMGGPPWARDHGGWQNGAIPPELAGLAELAPGERFAHFRGAQVQLADKDNAPVTVEVIPGTITATSATSLTITANDGSTMSFTIDDKTNLRGKSAPAQNDKAVVVTMNGRANAHAVVAFAADGAPWGANRGWH